MFVRCSRAVSTIQVVVALAVAVSAHAQDTLRANEISLHGFILSTYRTGDPLTVDGYRLRKADLKFSGDVTEHMRWRISFDAAKVLTLNKKVAEINDTAALTDATLDQRSRMLQDAALTYIVDRSLGFDIGQQIVPEGLEGTYSTDKVETIERTLFVSERSRAVGLGDVRDVGVSANGFVARGVVEYHVGLFNELGESAGTTDQNPQKAVIGRIAIHPSFLPQIQFGGTGGYGGGSAVTRHERSGGEAEFRDHGFTLRGELMHARDGLLRRMGWYGLGAYRPNPRLQFVGRYDWWDRDLGAEEALPNALETQVTVGASFRVEGSAKLAFNVIRQEFPHISSVRSGTILLAGFSGLW
jgi:hypothetical protein